LQTRVEVCEAVLATFRRVNQAAAADRSNQLASVADTLMLVHHDADRRVGLRTRLEMNLPETVEGFDNSYLATLLLPLVENAVEASPHNGVIELSFSDHETYVQFEVGNDVREPVVMDIVFTPGGSTKDGHEGLGVPTARWLAESVRGGSLIANVNDDRFRVLVRLPRRTR
jgi:sensor histidine kinase regulating citrate/malate metabolism